MNWTVFLAQALVQQAAWEWMVRVVQSNAVPLIQRACVLAVLNHHKAKAAAMVRCLSEDVRLLLKPWHGRCVGGRLSAPRFHRSACLP